MKEFLDNFYNNPKEWYKKQIEEDFEFDEETQMSIIQEKFCTKDGSYSIQYIKNPTKIVCLEAVKQVGWAIEYAEKTNQNFDIVQAFFDYDWEKSDIEREDCYEYLSKKFITKEQGLIMIEDNPEYINLLSKKIQREILEIKPGLEKYIDKRSLDDDEE